MGETDRHVSDYPATAGEPLAKRQPSRPARVSGKLLPYKLGPHSRIFARGAIGNMDGNSAEAKFVRAIEAGLVAHLGGKPAIPQLMLVRRISRAMLQLELLDAKQPLTDHDLRLASSLDSRVRLGLKVLGLEGAASQGRPGAALDAHIAALLARQSGESVA